MNEDKNIEQFFKKRLESNEFPYQEKDWQDLEQKLDAAGMVPSAMAFSPVKLIIVGVIISSLAFVLGWLLRERLFVLNNPSEQVETTAALEKGRVAENIQNRLALEEGSGLEKPSASHDDINTRPTKKTQVWENRDGSSIKIDSQPNEPAEVMSGSNDPSGTFFDGKEEATMSVSNYSTIRQIRSKREVPVFIRTEKKPSVFPLLKDKVVQGRSSMFRDRWSIGLSLAPDLNSIGFTAPKSLSPKIGLQLFYRISPRWLLSTGAFYNKKRYETDAEGYSPPDGYWYYGTNGLQPDNIIGSCGVLDVPVKIYYQFYSRKRFDFYGSVGISSYFLQDESYDFEFDQPNPGSEDGWHTEENSSALAGVVNASLLVGMKISPRSTLLAEPYMKVPTTQMGWGNVDLFSTGVLFTWKYIIFQPKSIN